MEPRLSILILEGSRDDAKLIQRALAADGLAFNAVHVQTREEFVAVLAQCAFDVLLADYRFPELGGPEALEIAKEYCPHMPTILVTGTLPDEMAVHLLGAGVVDYVLKDRLSRLGAAVRRAVEDASIRAAAREAEQALRQSEERFRTLAEAAPLGIFRTDAKGRFVYVNPCWEELSGRPAEAALGDGWLHALHPDDRAARARHWQEAVSLGCPSAGEYRFRRPDGTVAWVFARSVPERGLADEIAGFLGTATDITALKEAEANLNWQLDELRRFQQVTVDRELRMREILEENWRLRESLAGSHA